MIVFFWKCIKRRKSLIGSRCRTISEIQKSYLSVLQPDGILSKLWWIFSMLLYSPFIITWSTVLPPCIKDMCEVSSFPRGHTKDVTIQIPNTSRVPRPWQSAGLKGWWFRIFKFPEFHGFHGFPGEQAQRAQRGYAIGYSRWNGVHSHTEVNIEWEHMKPPWLRILQSLSGPRQHRSD